MRFFLSAIVLLICLLLPAEQACAVQAHGGSEGLVVHLIGHLLFLICMVYLLFSIRGSRNNGSGWFEFKWFLRLIIAWNVLTFSGHWLHEFVPDSEYIRNIGHITSFKITSITDAYFYLTRLDHLVLVPAFIFLLLALRKWRCED